MELKPPVEFVTLLGLSKIMGLVKKYKLHYCLNSQGLYLSYDDAILTNDLNELYKLVDLIDGNDDSIYVQFLDSNDRLIINGDELKGKIFLEIDTAIGGVLDQTLDLSDAKIFLGKASEILEDCIENPNKYNFEISPY